MLVRHTTIIQVDLENSHKSSSGLMELCVGMSFSENHFVIYFVVQPCFLFQISNFYLSPLGSKRTFNSQHLVSNSPF